MMRKLLSLALALILCLTYFVAPIAAEGIEEELTAAEAPSEIETLVGDATVEVTETLADVTEGEAVADDASDSDQEIPGDDDPACNHVNWYMVETERKNYTYETDGYDFHIARYEVYYEKLCRECGAFLDDNYMDRFSSTEGHNFEDGVCVNCGQAACRHESLTYFEEMVDLEIISITSSYHTISYHPMRTQKCNTCGKLFTSGEIDNLVVATEIHDFTADGWCKVCSYQQKRESTPGEADRDPSTKPSTPAATPDEAEREKPSQSGGSTGSGSSNTGNTGSTSTARSTTPAVKEMVSTLLDAVESAEKVGATVEVVGAQELLSEAEYERFTALTVQEQVLVTLSSIGMKDVVEAAMVTMRTTLSDEAAALIADIEARMAALTAEERAALEETLALYFPVETVMEGGVAREYFVIQLQLTTAFGTSIQRYGFRYDELTAQWVFVNLEAFAA